MKVFVKVFVHCVRPPAFSACGTVRPKQHLSSWVGVGENVVKNSLAGHATKSTALKTWFGVKLIQFFDAAAACFLVLEKMSL
jgi:hypothetical protein